MIHIYYCPVSVDQELGYDIAGYSASGFLIGCNPGVGQAAVISRLNWGMTYF